MECARDRVSWLAGAVTDAAAAEFAALLARSEDDPRVLGVILNGSRAREGTVTAYSDYDVLLVVADEAEGHLFGERRRDARLDVSTMTLSEFRTHALPGSASDWNRYAFAHCKVLKDTGEGLIAALIDEKSRMSPAEAAQRAPLILDAFLNSLYRCVKNDRDGNLAGARLDGAEAVPPYLTYLFALHHRVRPYNKYLVWELEHYPLSRPEWAHERLVPRLIGASSEDAARTVQSLFVELEAHARAAGHGPVIDEWGPTWHSCEEGTARARTRPFSPSAMRPTVGWVDRSSVVASTAPPPRATGRRGSTRRPRSPDRAGGPAAHSRSPVRR